MTSFVIFVRFMAPMETFYVILIIAGDIFTLYDTFGDFQRFMAPMETFYTTLIITEDIFTLQGTGGNICSLHDTKGYISYISWYQ